MKIPTLENVYQAMVVQKNLVDQFNVKLNGLSSKVKTLQNNRPYIMTSNNIENISGWVHNYEVASKNSLFVDF